MSTTFVSRGLYTTVFTVTIAAVPSGAARAEDSAPPVFGRPGQVVLPQLAGVRTGVPQHFAGGIITSSNAAGVANVGWGGVLGYSQSESKQSTAAGAAGGGTLATRSESFWLAPAADVFVARNVSIGLGAGVLWSQFRQEGDTDAYAYASDAFSIAAAPRVGYVVRLGRGLSFWPRLSVGASYAEEAIRGTGAGGEAAELYTSGRSFSAGLDLALVYHPHERLLFQVAPQISGGWATRGGPWASEGSWVRVGGEATAGLVF